MFWLPVTYLVVGISVQCFVEVDKTLSSAQLPSVLGYCCTGKPEHNRPIRHQAVQDNYILLWGDAQNSITQHKYKGVNAGIKIIITANYINIIIIIIIIICVLILYNTVYTIIITAYCGIILYLPTYFCYNTYKYLWRYDAKIYIHYYEIIHTWSNRIITSTQVFLTYPIEEGSCPWPHI